MAALPRSIQVGRETLRLPPEAARFLATLQGVIADAVVRDLPQRRDDGAVARLMATIAETQSAETTKAFQATQTGRVEQASIACAAGCAFCCRNSVEITIPEAIALAHAAGQGADSTVLIARFQATAPLIQGLKPLKRQSMAIPCPVLVEEACSRYAARPLACRSTYATSAQACERDLASVSKGGPGKPIKMPATPQVIRTGVVDGITSGLARRGLQADTVELIAATTLVLSDATAVDRWFTGERVFTAFVR